MMTLMMKSILTGMIRDVTQQQLSGGVAGQKSGKKVEETREDRREEKKERRRRKRKRNKRKKRKKKKKKKIRDAGREEDKSRTSRQGRRGEARSSTASQLGHRWTLTATANTPNPGDPLDLGCCSVAARPVIARRARRPSRPIAPWTRIDGCNVQIQVVRFITVRTKGSPSTTTWYWYEVPTWYLRASRHPHTALRTHAGTSLPPPPPHPRSPLPTAATPPTPPTAGDLSETIISRLSYCYTSWINKQLIN